MLSGKTCGNYVFRNKICPECGKTVGPYSYALVNGRKVHLTCWRNKKA